VTGEKDEGEDKFVGGGATGDPREDRHNGKLEKKAKSRSQAEKKTER